MDLKEAYKMLQSESGIEKGDTIKIIRIPKEREMGWGLPFPDNVPNVVGNIFKVVEVDENGARGIKIKYEDDYHFWVPFFVCEIVEKAKKDEVSEILKDIDFGCQQENVEKLVREIIKFKKRVNVYGKVPYGHSFSFDTSIFDEYQEEVDSLLKRLLEFIVKKV